MFGGFFEKLQVMIDPENKIPVSKNFRQIEDIIDARKSLGQYNVYKQSNGIHFRYVYSSSIGATENSTTGKVDDMMVLNERNPLNNLSIKQTDSEITVVRVKGGEITLKCRQSKWNMHDVAVPGDGSHLGESPSMVNLVTLVDQNVPCEGEEYLVPLSSWDPYLKHEDAQPDLKCCSDSNFEKINNKILAKPEINTIKHNFNEQEENLNNSGVDLVFRRRSWAGRISKFLRKHCKKSKTLTDSCSNKN